MNSNLATATMIDFPVKTEMKVCRACEVEKPVSEFYTKQRGNKRGYAYRCKPCQSNATGAERGRIKPYTPMDEIRKIDADGNWVHKRCPTCLEVKTADGFYANKTNASCLSSQCRVCIDKKHYKNMAYNPDFMRNKNMINAYGITLNDARKMLSAQHGVCANRACGKEIIIDTKRGNKQKAFVDHDHETGKVRELLCISCNTALGLLEQKNKMLGLTEYLEKHQLKQGDNRGN